MQEPDDAKPNAENRDPDPSPETPRSDRGARAESPSGKDALEDIARGLTGLFASFRGVVEEIAEKAQNAGRADNARAARTGGVSGAVDDASEVTVDTPAGPLSAIAGWRVRTLSGARRQSPDFERARADEPGPDADGFRTAFVDVFDEPDAWVATIELPGVAPEEVGFFAEAGRLVIETAGARRFRAEAELPAEIGPAEIEADAQTRLSNGILEIRVPKTAEAGRAPSFDARV